jgi:hypothetical protein
MLVIVFNIYYFVLDSLRSVWKKLKSWGQTYQSWEIMQQILCYYHLFSRAVHVE